MHRAQFVSDQPKNSLPSLPPVEMAKKPTKKTTPLGLTIEQVAIGSLKRDPKNAKTHTERDLAVTGKSLAEFGQVEPLVVWKNVVIGGNGRLEAMQSLGWKTAQIHRVDHLTEAQARKLAIVLNRSSQLSEWNPDVLLSQLRELESVDVDLSGLGFDVGDVSAIADAALRAAGVGDDATSPAIDEGGSDPAESRAGKTSAAASDPRPDVFQILITCRDEAHQTELLDRFEAEEIDHRPLTR